ncbi:adenosylcobinamide-phosphate synthase CbiB [Granulicella arctica]|uniref:Cobalamin biosynthesis protein CobD n=1 Tax=Granulicella arctica TaxID=940613 RepID=A0A7Y9TLE1_9BACT|nr:adenosylcobinamide-phosphate synthase CbiB [Granulicella arctica]NYF80037.1 adenosylcobinamide-phosphate synthase [Granulicella arctica]
MNRSLLLPASYLLDQIAGDPEWLPHPVRLIGFAILRGEAVLRRSDQTNTVELATGAILTFAVVGSTYWLTAQMIRQAHHCSRSLGDMTELLLGWTCLAARNLQQEATTVTEALECGDIILARRRLTRIVGRDTDQLSAEEISRAVIETVAESASDGIMAPLFYMALGGVPLAMAYKAVNTLDSMIGHADAKYFYFGKAAARLDDVANYLPARLTALAVVAASQLVNHSDPQGAWHTWQCDGTKHKSPNAGHPESAMAGALHVALGGDNTYEGELIPAQRLGQEFPPATTSKATQAIRLVSVASLIGLSLGVLLTTFIQTRKRR